MCNALPSTSVKCMRSRIDGVTSHKKFVRDYYDAIATYTLDTYPEEICDTPSISILQSYAEKEFRMEFHEDPTHAVFAPGLVKISGENTDFNDGKVLAMAIPLFVVIVGTRRNTSKWCKVKTLSRQVQEENYHEFFINSNGLNISGKPSWIKYIKGVIRCFRVRRELIPGFKIVIMSSIPIKSGLGSSSALTVAMYNFLEVITNVYTINVIEKGIACQLAEQICSQAASGIGDPLFSIIGTEGQIIGLDTRTLEVEAYDWKPINIDLILINSARNGINNAMYRRNIVHLREVAFALNMTSLRGATVKEVSSVESLFPEDLINKAKHIISENVRVSQAITFIKERRWKRLGKLMWESHYSMQHELRSSCVEIDNIMEAVQNVNGVLGARMAGRGFGGCVVVMIQRNAVGAMIESLRHIIESQEYHIVTASMGADILYKDSIDHPLKLPIPEDHAKKVSQYYLTEQHAYDELRVHYYDINKDKPFEPFKSVSSFIRESEFN